MNFLVVYAVDLVFVPLALSTCDIFLELGYGLTTNIDFTI
jgi:hypothetical protein